MAAPRMGIDYFPFYVDFFESDVVRLLSAEFGGWKAEFVIIRILAKIYKEGYYYKWGNDECLLLSKAIGVNDCSSGFIHEVVKGLVRRRFFDEGCFKESNVLTSIQIQESYVRATKERKPLLDRPYWLLPLPITPSPEEKPQENPEKPPTYPEKPPTPPQSKVNDKDIYIAPSIEDFRNYFLVNGFSASLADRAFMGYDVAGWKDSRGKVIKNWKQKCIHVWFSPENKLKDLTSSPVINAPALARDDIY